MPLKDLTARAAYRKAYYIASAEKQAVWQERSKLRRRDVAAEKRRLKALEPVVVQQRACQDCGADITTAYVPKHGCRCKACVAVYQKAYRAGNKARIAASKKQWAVVYAERKAAQDRGYAQASPEKRALARRKWSAANPGKDNACKAKNRIARAKRVPTWLDEDDKWIIEQAYELAALRTKMFGFPWHVDHVLPLNGRKVSGLHVATNLQVIPGVENSRKHNRYEVA